MLSMDILSKEIEKTASISARKYNISFEDQVQDLWLFILEKQPENIAIAKTMLTNKAIDLCRAYTRKENGLRSVDFEDPVGEMFINSEASGYHNNKFDNPEDMSTVESLVNSLSVGSRERIFVVCKVYLIEGFEFLADEFRTYYEKLSEIEKEQILEADRYTDDLIAKVFLGIKTGTNSGSMRTIKNNLKSWKLSLVF